MKSDVGLQVLTTMLERRGLAALLGQQYGGKRDLYEVLGYNRLPGYADYLARYERQDIAGMIVELPAQDTWRTPPTLRDGKSEASAFLGAWKSVAERLGVWHYLRRLDTVAGIGRFGVLVLGLRDVKRVRGRPAATALSDPVQAGSLAGPDDVLYFTVKGEGAVEIAESDLDASSPRFGLPQVYEIQFGTAKTRVHWTRVIHVAEGLLEDDVYGTPRLRRVHNLLDDLIKVVGGGAEAAWRRADPGVHVDVRDEYELGETAEEELEEQVEAFVHQWKKFLMTRGVDVEALAGEVQDTSGLAKMILSLIAGATGIPQRILLGSERGELASRMDENTWAGSIRARRAQFAEPRILRALIDRLIWAGALPAPDNGGYEVVWTPLFEVDDKEASAVAETFARAVAQYAPGDAASVVTVEEFRERWLRLPALAPRGG